MPTKIISKKSSIAASVPIASDLAVGEIAVNTADKRQYTKHTDNSILELGINPSSVSTGSISVGGVAITATPAEINKLDGFTGSVSDLNKVAAVTASAVELNLLDGVTATTAELNTLDGITATAATLNGLNGRVNSNDSDINGLDARVNSNDSDINGLDTRVTANDGDITTLQGRATDLETFEATAGTAYTKNVTVFSTDTTANRLTKVGDFGLGGGSPPTVSDLNLLNTTGFYRTNPGVNGNPSGGAWEIIHTQFDGNSSKQIAFRAGSQALLMYVRVKGAGVWYDWREVWHSENLVKTVGKEDTTAGSMLKVGDFGVGLNELVTSTDTELETVTGFKRIVNTTLNSPFSFGTLLIQGYNSNNTTLLALQTNGSGIYRKSRVNGTWGDWVEVWTNENLVKTTSATDTTAGSMLKVGDFGVGAHLFSSGGNIGIGTTTPSEKLTVNGTMRVTQDINVAGGKSLKFNASSFMTPENGVSGAEVSTAGAFTVKTGSSPSERMRINSVGNVGIGTTAPDSKLSVASTSGTLVSRFQGTVSNGCLIGIDQSTLANWRFGQPAGENAFAFYGFGGGSHPEFMRISASGNVGIGTASPSSTLHVNDPVNLNFKGEIKVGGTGTSRVLRLFQESATEYGLFASGNASFLKFGTGGVGGAGDERMRIDTNGNVGIGTSTGSDKLNVSQASGGTILSLRSQGTSGAFAVVFQNPNGIVGNITISGTTTSYNTSSDKRLKENIVDSQSASNDIDSVQVRQFDWKADNKHQEYGFIAQELKEVAPYAVHTPEDTDEMQSVDYSKLVPMMIKELQELRKRVLTLENK